MVIASNKQTFWDISVQETGTISNALAIAEYNGMDVTDDIENGTELHIPDNLLSNKKVLDYYKRKAIKPATNV